MIAYLGKRERVHFPLDGDHLLFDSVDGFEAIVIFRTPGPSRRVLV